MPIAHSCATYELLGVCDNADVAAAYPCSGLRLETSLEKPRLKRQVALQSVASIDSQTFGTHHDQEMSETGAGWNRSAMPGDRYDEAVPPSEDPRAGF